MSWVHVLMKIDVCPKFYSAPTLTYAFDPQVKVTDFDFLC